MKKLSLSIFIILLFGACANKKHIPAFEKDDFVYDFEIVLTDSEALDLSAKLCELWDSTSVQMVVATMDSSDYSGTSLFEHSLKMANEWGIGERKKNNGILIAVSVSGREMVIQNGYGIEEKVSDEETKKLIDEYFLPQFKEGNYYLGLSKGCEEYIKLLKVRF